MISKISQCLIIISLFITPLLAQENTTEAADSLTAVELPDSLNEEEVKIISIQELENKLFAYIRNRKYLEDDLLLPALVYQENFHQAAFSDPPLIFQKNGFSLLPYQVSNIHVLQNFNPLLLTTLTGPLVNFHQENYQLRIPLTSSFLALGDNNMNHAGIWFAKGDILGIRKLNLEAAYLGQEGDWLGVNETSRNFNFHLFHRFNLGELHFNSTIIDQEIPALKLTEAATEAISFNEKFSDLSLKFLNNFLNLGIRFEEWEVGDQKRRTRGVNLNRDIDWQQQHLNVQYEYLQQRFEEKNDDLNIVSLHHHSQLWGSSWKNRIRYLGKNDRTIYSSLNLKTVGHLFFAANYFDLQVEKTGYPMEENKTALGLLYLDHRSSSALSLGETAKTLYYDSSQEFVETNFKYSYLEFINKLRLGYGPLQVFLKNYFSHNLDFDNAKIDDRSFVPAWRSSLELELKYDLQHNNALSLGIINRYNSDFFDITEDMIISEQNYFDLFIALQVSELFRIKLDLINLTDEDSFPYIIDRMEGAEQFSYDRHININVNWMFIN